MRISIVVLSSMLSGGVRVIAKYAGALQRRGHEVTIVTRPLSLRQRVRELTAGRVCLRGTDFGHNLYKDAGVSWSIHSRDVVPGKNEVPDGDVVIATHWRTVSVVDELGPSKGQKIYFAQGWEQKPGEEAGEREAWYRPFHKIVIAEWLVNIGKELGVEDSVSLVPNSVDARLFHAPEREKQRQPTVGMLIYHNNFPKGCDICWEAIRIARKSEPALRAVTFGQSPRFRLDLPENTIYHRRPPQARIKDVYAAADVWLWGSRSEGFGLPILEAMACRTPVISTATGAAPEILRNGGGILMSGFEPQEMADAIARVNSLSADEWRAMSSAAYTTATRGTWVSDAQDEYTWDDAAELFERALKTAIESA